MLSSQINAIPKREELNSDWQYAVVIWYLQVDPVGSIIKSIAFYDFPLIICLQYMQNIK